MGGRFYVETLGCPKNAVDSDKLAGALATDGLEQTGDLGSADVVVVNTCAFVEAARRESIEVILAAAAARKPGARLVVTGCLAERAGPELAAALPEVDAVVGFAEEGAIADVLWPRRKRRVSPSGVRDLLELPRPPAAAPWAYVKVAEGCDRTCAFCAIPSFRGRQRSRTPDSVVAEARDLVAGGVSELVLVAQDLAWYGRDAGEAGALVGLLGRLDRELAPGGLRRVRLLYLYPSELRRPLVDAILETPTVVPYFDLSLQHASAPLLRRMRRFGHGDLFRQLVAGIRSREPDAVFRSSFIVGFPGETEDHHAELLDFLADAELEWAGFFPFSSEEGTPAASMDGVVPEALVMDRLRECEAVQSPITQAARDALIGCDLDVLVDGTEDGAAVGRTHREAPEIDGVVILRGEAARPGETLRARAVDALGPDLVAEVLVESVVGASG